MKELVLNTWHCDECEYVFYVELEADRLPDYCPNCKSIRLSDSKVLEAKPLDFKK